MKKILRILGIVLLSIIIIYMLFIVEESIRLKKEGQYPFVILDGGYCDKNGNLETH